MTRVLLICDAGDGLLDLGLRAQACNHQVRYFLRKFDARTRPVGKGLLERVPDWHGSMDWADLVLLEANGFAMREMDSWRRRGCLIIGGNDESASWELDRSKGMEVFRRAGIPVPPYREFSDYDQAIRHVERHGEVMYSKPCSDTADKALSAKTGIDEDPSWQLRKWKRKHGRPPSPFLLQDAVKGIEFAVGAWFGPAGFADGWEENFEEKKLMAGGQGPNCGEMGTVLRYTGRSKLADAVLAPLEEQLAAISYCGNVDVNCIVDEDGSAWPLEFTMRFGWPAWNIETALLDCDPIEFLAAVACGDDTRGAHRMGQAAVGVVMALPPFPNPPRDYEEVIGVPLYGLTEELCEHFHPAEMQAGEDTMLCSAGDYLGIATGTGATVREAARGAYGVLRKLSMPASPFHRIDIGQRLRKELPKLQEHGFAQGLEY
jgi:phosphoribosylamine--glycine ligase